QQGLYDKQSTKIYAMVHNDTDNKKYKTIAFEEAMSDISNQLFSQVSSEQFLDKQLSDDEFSQNFKHKIYIVSNLPIHGVIKEQEKVIDDKYYLLMSFDKKSVSHIYKDKANELAKELDIVLEDYKKQNNLSTKEIILNTLSKKLESYEKYSLIAKLLNQKNISKPKVKPYFIEKQIREIYNITSNNIEDLTKILAKTIRKSKIKNSIKVMPFFYEDKGTYSSFSSQLQNHLENELSKIMNITTSQDALFKLSGNFFLKEDHIIVKAVLYDSFGDIELVSMAKMKIKKKDKKYYIPKVNEYSSLNEPILNKNLDVQVRINKMTKNLLFKKGEAVNIEVKVSKESYIYIIGNMRTKDGKQIQYLMPLNYNKDKTKYQMHIPYQNSNLWVSIGEFEVYPPFGVEVLQVFATNIDILKQLPYTQIQNINGEEYDVIVDENKKTMVAARSISNMRGLKRLKENKELQKAEVVLKFTTVRE
ncbi:MAG: DUF4384 domain-containing protein, partial [Campylobacterota bacterium]|nr:DUF4384 domain-containing protein [Campylobacterota bacterium]